MNSKRSEFSRLIDDAASQLERDEAGRGQRIEIFIDYVTKILRFIDRKILVNIQVQSDDNDLKFNPEYYPINGILVYVHNVDHQEPAKITLKINEVFPLEQKEAVITRMLRGGEEIYLIRTGKLLGFERKGEVWDAGPPDKSGDYYSLINPREYTPLDLVRRYDDFGVEFLFHFKLAVVNAVKRNENKRFMLKKVIEYIHKAELRERKERDFKNAIASAPQDPNVYLEYADFLYQDKEDYDGATEQFAKALTLDPQNAQIYLQEGEFWQSLYRRAKYKHEGNSEEYRQKAGASLKRALELAPTSSAAHSSYASHLWMCDEKEKVHLLKREILAAAEKHYLKALELDSANIDAMTDYSFFLFWAKRDYEKVIQVCEKLVELDPHSDGIYMNCAGILSMTNRNFRLDPELKRRWTSEKIEALLDKADLWYRKAVEIAPEKGYVHIMYADFLQWEKHDTPLAERELQKAIELYPHHLWSYMRYGDLLLLAKQDRTGAETQYRKALQEVTLDDDRLRGFLSLRIASIEFFTGREKEALDRLEATLTSTKNLEASLAGNFYIYAHTSDIDRRVRAWDEIKALLDKGVRLNQWAGLETCLTDIPLHVKQAMKAGHPKPKFLRRLGQVIIGVLPAKMLESE